MAIKKVSFGTGIIDVSSDDTFGLTLQKNINVSTKFNEEVDGKMKTTHRII